MTKPWKGRKSRRVRMGEKRKARMKARAQAKRNFHAAELIRGQMASGGALHALFGG